MTNATDSVSAPRQCLWSSDGREGPQCTQSVAAGEVFCTGHLARLPDQSEWLDEVALWRDEYR